MGTLFSYQHLPLPLHNYRLHHTLRLHLLSLLACQLDEWTTAEILRDEFTHNQSQRDTVDTTAQLENEAEATIELSASFLAYVAESIAKDQSTQARTALLVNVFKYFMSTNLATKDIYSLTSTFDTDTRKTVLSDQC